jgi:hypothetical protein
MPEPVIIIILLVLLLVGGWLLVRYYQRRRILAGLAYRLQFRFAARQDASLRRNLAGLYMMQLGHAARAYNYIVGRQDEFELTVFHYDYETGFGLGRSQNYATIVVWKTKTPLPSVVALRENRFQPIGRFLHFTKMKMPDSEFADALNLFSDFPEESLLPLFTPDVRQVLLQCRYANWEFHDRYIVFFVDRVLSARQLHRLIRRGLQIAKLLS